MSTPTPSPSRLMAGGGAAWYVNAPIGDVRKDGATGDVMLFGHDVQGNPIRIRLTAQQARLLGPVVFAAGNYGRKNR